MVDGFTTFIDPARSGGSIRRGAMFTAGLRRSADNFVTPSPPIEPRKLS